jgi:hypothetical protein
MMRVWGSPVIGNGHKRFTSSSLVTHTHTTQIPHIQTPPLPPKSSPSRPVYKAPYTTSKEDPSVLRKRIPPSSARGSLRPPQEDPSVLRARLPEPKSPAHSSVPFAVLLPHRRAHQRGVRRQVSLRDRSQVSLRDRQFPQPHRLHHLFVAHRVQRGGDVQVLLGGEV